MKIRTILTAGTVAAIFLCGCAKEHTSTAGENAKRAFDAWVSVNKTAAWTQSPLGSWVIERHDSGSGVSLGTAEEKPFVLLDFVTYDLKGNMTSSSRAQAAKQLGTYKDHYYYGPQMTCRSESAMYIGINEIIDTMHKGDSVKAVVPRWLLTTTRQASPEAYVSAYEGEKEDEIYDFTILDSFTDEVVWERKLMADALGTEAAKADSLAEGLYMITDKPSDKPDTVFTEGNIFYVNYICRRIDGQGVDTNIADSAKVFGTYSSSTKYGPTQINYNDDYTKITMTSSESSVIAGFAYAIRNIKPHQKVRAFMLSYLAYGSSGSGTAIPPYCPLIFEIEMVDEPK